MIIFIASNTDGSPKVCKFCGQPVWWHILKRRWYEPGGAQLHCKNCPGSSEHAAERGRASAQASRQRRAES